MRGGSSRGAFFLDEDLPQDEALRHAILLATYGSPDSRQIDGIGGSDPLTSKAAVVKASTRPDADVDYTFYQVGIGDAAVSMGGTCGNMLAAVGPFALLRGLLPAKAPITTIRIYATNTKQVIVARVPVADGLPSIEGDCSIAGVPGTGAAIRLDFGNCAGAVSGTLLPTGAACDQVELDGTTIEVSLIDAATPFVFVRADALGATGTELPDELRADTGLMDRLEKVRGWAAVKLGLVDDPDLARSRSPNIPRVIMVAPPTDYRSSTGEAVAGADIDICVRQLAMQRPHRALAVTGAVCAAVACSVRGSVVADALGRPSGDVRLGHPSGVLRVASQVDSEPGGKLVPKRAEIERTARLIMDGTVYARRTKVEALYASVKAARE